MIYYHRNNWPCGKSTLINTHGGAASVKVMMENRSVMADIVNITVVPNKRGKGWGRELLSLAEEEARNMGAKMVQLSSVEGNDFTLDWYKRAGYEVSHHDGFIHCVVLRKSLPDTSS
jgi:ribosomal protein S18 acetylase RimI-like enzyme